MSSSGKVSSSEVRILAVDDDPGLLRVVQRVLSPRYTVEVAHCVRDALDKLRRKRYDIAVVDVQMPDGDGYELNRELHRISPGTDVILMTGSTSQQDRKLFQALDEDVFYFLFKPFHRRVLTALVERCLRARHLDRENRRHLERLASDQEKARHIQRRLVPEGPVTAADWYLEARFRPCEEVSGDLFAIIPVRGDGDREDAVAIAVIDVIGHGLPAAMYAGMLRATLDAARRLDPSPQAVFDRLFEGLDFFAPNSGASMFYGLLEAGGRLRYFSAGHPAALLLTPNGVESLGSTGPMLSSVPLIATIPRGTRERQLEPEHRLLAYTDGILEAKAPNNDAYGQPALESVFQAGGGKPVGHVLDDLLESLEHHRGGRPLDDDVTLLLAERRPEGR